MQKCGHWAALGSAPLPLFQSPPHSLSHFFSISILFFLFLMPHSSLFQHTLSLLNFFPLCFLFPAVPLTDSLLSYYSCLCLLSWFMLLFSLTHLSILHPHHLFVLVFVCFSPSKTPLTSYRPPPSVPASGRGALGAAAAAQGQLPTGGDEAGQHPEGVPRGDLHLWRGTRGFREWRKDETILGGICAGE